MQKFLLWLPRILAISLNGFLALFALDVLSLPQWWLALLIHLIPNFILAGLTAIAWYHPRLGANFFWLIGLLSIGFYHSYILALPLFILGVLFWLSEQPEK